MKTYAVVLIRSTSLLMSTHNICFCGEIRKIFSWHPLLSRPMHVQITSIHLPGMAKSRADTTRAGVCKTLCPQLLDSNTVWLQHCLAMTVTTVQIYDFNVILSKGNNSKIGDDWDKKKIRITYFFMRNPNMKFQNISIHGSKLMLYTIKQRH